MEKETNDDQFELIRLITNKWLSKPIYAACRLGIADILSKGPRPIKELSEISGTDARSLYRVLRALSCVGIFTEVDKEVFDLTPMAGLLKTGEIGFSYSMMFNDSWNDKAWLKIVESIKTGKSGFEISYGMPLFRWLEKKPDILKIFEESNSARSRRISKSVSDAYDFSKANRVIDVGGGKGDILIEILLKYKGISGSLADISITKATKDNIDRSGLSKRCKLVKCDFFKKVPSGGDVYILSSILHDWDDKDCMKILSNIRKNMNNDSRILVLEMLIPRGNKFSVSKLLDLEMMMITGGLERTEDEFKRLFRSSGLRLINSTEIEKDNYMMEIEKRF